MLIGSTKSGASEYKQDMMMKMFRHYNEHSFIGNAGALTAVLERRSHTLLEFSLPLLKISVLYRGRSGSGKMLDFFGAICYN